jgi:hypothetical protein
MRICAIELRDQMAARRLIHIQEFIRAQKRLAEIG